jgi:hypothetical protein
VAFSITRVGKFNNMPIRVHYTYRVIDLWANACRITGIVITISCTLCIAPVVKLQYGAISICHTHRFVDVRAPEGAWARNGIAIIIIKVTMAFCEAIVIKLNGMAIGIRYTYGIIEFRTNARSITRYIIAEACALCITPVLKFNNLP